MRGGLLGRPGDIGAPSQPQPTLGDTLAAGRATAQYNAGKHLVHIFMVQKSLSCFCVVSVHSSNFSSDQSIPTSQHATPSSLTWQQHSGMDLGATPSLTTGQAHPGLDTKSHNKENEDVEIMSSDSSSSSSSDD